MKIDISKKILSAMLVVLFSLLVVPQMLLAQQLTAEREYEPVVLVGGKLSPFFDVPIEEIYLYVLKSGSWRLIPFQIDEQTYGPDSLNAATSRWWYFVPTWWADTDSILIASHDSLLSDHDELVFLVRDLGERASADNWIDNSDSRNFSRLEIEVSDPNDLNKKAYGYLYRSATIGEPIPEYYQFSVSPSLHQIGNANYAVRLSATTGLIEDIRIQPPLGNGADIFDTQKIRFSGVLGLGPFPITIGRNNRPAANERDNLYVYDNTLREEDVDNIKYTANPRVRVIRQARQTIRFGSLDLGELGFYFFVQSKFYPFSGTLEGGADLDPEELKELFDVEDDVFIELDVLRQSWDFNAAATGMKFYNEYNNGITIDGVMETPNKKIDVPIKEWLLTTGEQGTFFTQIEFEDTSWQSIELYWYDNLNGGQGDNTLTPGGDTGDSVSYGDQGILFTQLDQESVSLKLGFTAYFLEKNLQQSDGANLSDIINHPVTVAVYTNTFTGVENHENNFQPEKFQLLQNYPNPFNSWTKISFELPHSEKVALKIFDINGRLVKTLADKTFEAGRHSLIWNGKNESGTRIASGIYFYKIITTQALDTKKLILLY